jgi:hypothetical protein
MTKYSTKIIPINAYYQARQTEEKDYRALNDAYNKFTGRNRTIEQFLWEWVNSPCAPNESWLIEYLPTQEIIGHHGVQKFSFTENGYPITVGRTENTFVDPVHIKNFYYPGLEKKLLSLMSNRFKYIFTSAPRRSEGAISLLRQRLGYKSAGRLAWFMLNFYYKAILNLCRDHFPSWRILSHPLAVFLVCLQKILLMLRWPLSQKIDVITIGWGSIDEVSRFWEEQKKYYGVTVDRSTKFLTWRFVKNPYTKFQLIKISYNKKLIGYAVLEKHNIDINQQPIPVWLVHDFIVEKARVDNYYYALIGMKGYFVSQAIIMLTISQEDSFNLAFGRFFKRLSNFFVNPAKDILVMGINKEFIPWYFTKISGYDAAQSW